MEYAPRKRGGSYFQDSRCDQDVRLFSQPGAAGEAVSALCLADDLLNCPFKKRAQLKWALHQNRPNTLRLVERIVDIASGHDLFDPEQNIEFRRKLVKEMTLGGVSSEPDEAKSMKDLILEVEGRASW